MDLLDSDGYDGWSVSTVARVARVSLRDGYKYFPLRDGLTWCFRRMLEPWENHPRLLEAYQRASGLVVGLDRSYVDDLSMTLANVLLGLITQVVRGEMALADVVPALERTVTPAETCYARCGNVIS